MSKLNYWTIIGDKAIGNVYEDERFNDGDFIITSKIKSMDFRKRTITTVNTTYSLLEPFEGSRENSDVAKPEENYEYL